MIVVVVALPLLLSYSPHAAYQEAWRRSTEERLGAHMDVGASNTLDEEDAYLWSYVASLHFQTVDLVCVRPFYFHLFLIY